MVGWVALYLLAVPRHFVLNLGRSKVFFHRFKIGPWALHSSHLWRRSAGFWIVRRHLEIWLRLFAPTCRTDSHGNYQGDIEIRNQWLLASSGGFAECSSLEDKLCDGPGFAQLPCSESLVTRGIESRRQHLDAGRSMFSDLKADGCKRPLNETGLQTLAKHSRLLEAGIVALQSALSSMPARGPLMGTPQLL